MGRCVNVVTILRREFTAAMVLLNNDFSSIVVAIEMGRLVFDNLKKVMIYLMPVRPLRNPIVLFLLRCRETGWDLHRVHDRLCQCIPRDATRSELIPSSLFLHHERRRHVDLSDV